MAEKQHRRSSIASSLQVLGKSTFGGNQAWENNEDKDNPAWSDHQQTSHTCSINVTTSMPRSNPISLSPPGERISSSHDNRAYQSYRYVSMPLPTEQHQYQHRHAPRESKELGPSGKPSERSEEKSKSRVRRFKLRAPRLSTPSKSSETATKPGPRVFSTQEYTTSFKSQSRIPTPTKSPDGGLYSHKIYQKEGRRSVLSSLGRRYTSLKKNFDKDQVNIKRSISTKKTLREPRNLIAENNKQAGDDDHGPKTVASSYVPQPAAHVDQGESLSNSVSVAHTTRSQTMIPIPAAGPTSCSDVAEAGRRRQSLPLASYSKRRPARSLTTRLTRGSPTTKENGLEDATQSSEFPNQEENPMVRKVRISRASRRVLSKKSTEKEPQQSDTSAPGLRKPNPMYKPIDNVRPGRFRWTKSFESMKKSVQNTNTAAMQATQSNEDQPLSENQINRATITLSPKQEKGRRKDYNKRMVQDPEPTNSTKAPNPMEDENTQKKKTRKKYARPELTENTDSFHQVSHSQPSQYWLGRFVTLTNAFHYEDSFHQPDIATGFSMSSSYSRPLGSTEKNMPNYRIKRAFMILENACLTEEAIKSLQDFRNEYVAIHGNRWMA